jgi:hypothetical protein
MKTAIQMTTMLKSVWNLGGTISQFNLRLHSPKSHRMHKNASIFVKNIFQYEVLLRVSKQEEENIENILNKFNDNDLLFLYIHKYCLRLW